MVTTFGENAYVDRAIDLGVAGFLLKSGDPHDLIFGILAAAHGGSCLSPVVARRVMADLRAERRISRTPEMLALSGLSPRQRDILTLLAQAGPTQRSRATSISPKAPSRDTSVKFSPGSPCATE